MYQPSALSGALHSLTADAAVCPAHHQALAACAPAHLAVASCWWAVGWIEPVPQGRALPPGPAAVFQVASPAHGCPYLPPSDLQPRPPQVFLQTQSHSALACLLTYALTKALVDSHCGWVKLSRQGGKEASCSC